MTPAGFKALQNALLRMRHALLDLQQAGLHTEAAELEQLIRRLEAVTS